MACFFALQCGHFLIDLAKCIIVFIFFLLASSVFSFSSLFNDSINPSILLSSIKILLHSLHVALKTSIICFTYLTWIIGLANSIWPKCPVHSFNFAPQVLHLNPGSITPNLISINPPSTGYPSLSYNSGVTILAEAIFLIILGENTEKIMLFIFL